MLAYLLQFKALFAERYHVIDSEHLDLFFQEPSTISKLVEEFLLNLEEA